MAAPVGNNYWSFRGKHGNDFSYKPEELWDEAVKYFEWMNERVWNKKDFIRSGEAAGQTVDLPTATPFSLETFCLYADISFQTFLNYESNKDPWKGFFEIATRIRAVIESQQFEGATVGAYNPSIVARKLGLVDKKEVNANVNTGTVVKWGDGEITI